MHSARQRPALCQTCSSHEADAALSQKPGVHSSSVYCEECEQQQKLVYNTTPGVTVPLCLMPALTGRMMRSDLGNQLNQKSYKVPTKATNSCI